MSKIIIGIHGLGNKPDPETLSKWWLAALREGLITIGKSKLTLPFELVYWASLLHGQSLDPSIEDTGDPLYLEDPYLPADQKLKTEPPGKLRKRIIDYLGRQLEGMFLKDDLTINFSSVNDYVIRRFFGDLAVYYHTTGNGENESDQHKQLEIRDKLKEVLLKHRKREILLIAHSMGAIIAYDVLKQLGREMKVHTLITIGCPLGLPIIRSKIAAEHSETDNPKERLITPESVSHHWYNLADLRDKIALFYRLGDDFLPNSQGIRVIDKTVLNTYHQTDGSPNPHKAYGYLRTPELVRIVADFLEEEPAGIFHRLRYKIRNWLAA